MKNRFLSLSITCILASLVSCHSYGPHSSTGAVVGGLVGAGTGALIGEHNDRELEGAAIGGVIGALAGSALGGAHNSHYYGPRYSQSYYQRPIRRSYYAPSYHRSTRYYSSPRYAYRGGRRCY